MDSRFRGNDRRWVIFEGAKRGISVISPGANAPKHLLFLLGNRQKQILRYAQNGMAQGFISGLLSA